MKLTPLQRRLGLGGALVLTVALVVFGDETPSPISEPVHPEEKPRLSNNAELPDKPVHIALEKLTRTPELTEDGPDLFASKSWYVPPPQVITKPAPPPKPTAPKLPFGYVGQIEGKDGLIVFLTQGEELISTKAGEQIDKNYLLETVSSNQLTFVYLPLNQKQTLPIGDNK